MTASPSSSPSPAASGLGSEPASAGPVNLTPDQIKQLLDSNQCVLVDVREDAERNEERIPGSVAMPLSRFDAQALLREHPDAKLVFHCKAGGRSAKACAQIAEQLPGPAEHLAGGIDAWKAAGLPTVKPEGAPRIPIMRQVLLAAGGLVALGTLLALVSPWFLVIPGFVGAGLMVAGATGWCGMAMLLGKMPWNRSGRACSIAR